MGSGVVTVGRREYAVGLYWENSPSGHVTQAAKEAALQPGQKADFYAVRPGTKDGRVPQFGLAHGGGVPFKSGMPAFAGCLANQQPGSWAGAFHLNGGTVITIVRDELVVPDGDQFYANESEARDRLLQEIGFGGLLRVYAPESWAISGTDTMPISLLLNDRHDIRLRPAEIPKKMLMIAGAGVGVLLLVLGLGWYLTAKKEEDDLQRIQQQEAIERAKQAANKLVPSGFVAEAPHYPPPERKWEKQPPPLAIVEACRAGLAQIPVAAAGWRLSQLKCDSAALNFTWAREKGYALPPEHAVINDSGTTASRSITWSSLAPRGPEDLLNPKDITQRYLAQNWSGTIGRIADDLPPAQPADFHGTWAPPPPPWVKRSFTFTVQALPGDLPIYLDGLPGVVINSLTYTIGGTGSWEVVGVIYENRL